ncbi:MAG: transposase [Bacteroidales bacterium]|nr:transposase [Bacteroidales bacterium]
MSKYKNKYRVESHRMPNWDYSGNGIYYLTICINNRLCLLGNVENGQMLLNEYGKIAYNEWEISSEIRSEIKLDEFVIMPNHLHGIVIINNDNKQNNDMDDIDGTHDMDGTHVETHGRVSLHPTHPIPPSQPKLYRKPKSISSFIAGYKSSVTTQINKIITKNNGQLFNRKNRLWQVNYYDRIVRNKNDLRRIQKYIINNPINWKNDRNNQEGLWI